MFTDPDVTSIAKPWHSQRDTVDTKVRTSSKGVGPGSRDMGSKGFEQPFSSRVALGHCFSLVEAYLPQRLVLLGVA